MITVILTVKDKNPPPDFPTTGWGTEIELLLAQQGHLPAERNAALKKAKGEYVAFVGEKDCIDPDYFTYLLEGMHGVSMATCGYEIAEDTGELLYASPESQSRVLSGEEMTCRLFYQYHYQGYLQNKLFRRDLIRKKRITFDPKYGKSADFLFLVEYLKHASLVRMGEKFRYRFVASQEMPEAGDPAEDDMDELACYRRCKKILSRRSDAYWLCEQTI